MTAAACTAAGPYQRLYGICGGPTGDSYPVCINPGKALCEACPDVAPLPEEYGGLNIACSAPEYDDSFWDLASGDRTTCCGDLWTTAQLFQPVAGQPYYASRYAWLYDSMESCTDLRSSYPAP